MSGEFSDLSSKERAEVLEVYDLLAGF